MGLPVDQLQQQSVRDLKVIKDKLTAHGLHAEAEVLESYDPARGLAELVRESNPDLVVAGTASRHGLERLLLGSFAEELLRQLHCPVMIVGPEADVPKKDWMRLGSILFATQMDDNVAAKAGLALSLAQDNNAQIHLCHILPAGKGERAHMPSAMPPCRRCATWFPTPRTTGARPTTLLRMVMWPSASCSSPHSTART